MTLNFALVLPNLLSTFVLLVPTMTMSHAAGDQAVEIEKLPEIALLRYNDTSSLESFEGLSGKTCKFCIITNLLAMCVHAKRLIFYSSPQRKLPRLRSHANCGFSLQLGRQRHELHIQVQSCSSHNRSWRGLPQSCVKRLVLAPNHNVQ